MRADRWPMFLVALVILTCFPLVLLGFLMMRVDRWLAKQGL